MVRAAQLARGSYVSAAGADVSTARAAVGSRGGSPVAELATRRVRETRGEAQVVSHRATSPRVCSRRSLVTSTCSDMLVGPRLRPAKPTARSATVNKGRSARPTAARVPICPRPAVRALARLRTAGA